MVACWLVHRELPTGQELHGADGVETALCVDIEGANRFNFVIEQVDAIGHDRAHRKQVDQTTAYAELTRRGHLRNMRIVRKRQLRTQCGFVELVFLFERKGIRREKAWGRKAIKRRGDGDG